MVKVGLTKTKWRWFQTWWEFNCRQLSVCLAPVSRNGRTWWACSHELFAMFTSIRSQPAQVPYRTTIMYQCKGAYTLDIALALPAEALRYDTCSHHMCALTFTNLLAMSYCQQCACSVVIRPVHKKDCVTNELPAWLSVINSISCSCWCWYFRFVFKQSVLPDIVHVRRSPLKKHHRC